MLMSVLAILVIMMESAWILSTATGVSALKVSLETDVKLVRPYFCFFSIKSLRFLLFFLVPFLIFTFLYFNSNFFQDFCIKCLYFLFCWKKTRAKFEAPLNG